MEKLNFQQPLIQSWMLHDPSEIILILYADLLQKKHYCHECQKVTPPPGLFWWKESSKESQIWNLIYILISLKFAE